MNQPIKYRKKHVEAEAWLVTEENIEEVAKWCGGWVGGGSESQAPQIGELLTWGLWITRYENLYHVKVNEVVIEIAPKAFYSMPLTEFEQTYEKVGG